MDMQSMREFVATGTGKCRILVVGDVILDKYYYGEVQRISPEAPVPVNHVIGEKETLGGAANVAHNLALLGCQTSICGYVGNDHHCQSLMDKFISRGIDIRGLVPTESPTTTKIRILGGHQQMLRMDFEDTKPVEGRYATRVTDYVAQNLNKGLDCVILSDYGKGACTEEACQTVIGLCQEHDVPVLVDPKGTNWGKYSQADYITPNLKEINEVLPAPIQNEDAAVEEAARYVMGKFSLKNAIVTRSAKGLSLVEGREITHIPTRAQEVFDVSGAGDTVISVFAMALAGGLHPKESAYMANLAASVVVAKLGTYAVSKEELLKVLQEVEKE